MHRRCRWPPDTFVPPWVIALSMPSGIACTKPLAWAISSASHSSASRGVGPPVAQVRRHGAGEQERLLRDVADLAPQQVEVEFAHVDAVDQHGAVGGVGQSRHEVHERRLAGSRAADDRRRGAGLDPERQVAQHRSVGARVGEADVAELEGAALDDLGDRVLGLADGRRGVEHLDDAVGGDRGARDHRHHERHHHDGEQDLDEVAQVGDQRADLASGRRRSGCRRSRCTATLEMLMISITVGNVAPSGGRRGATCLGQFVVGLAKRADLLGLAHERPHDSHAGDLLTQHRG